MPEQQMRFTPDELAMIRQVFKDNKALINLMKKFFAPKLDPEAPSGQMVDIYVSIQTDNRSDADIAKQVMARNMLINHLNMRFVELEILAQQKGETTQELMERLKKDSGK